MSTNFKTYENPSIFHRWAAAQWRRPKDPTIYGATEVDMEPALAFLEKVREEWGVPVTVTHLVTKALAIAIARHPETNAKVRFWGKLEQRKTVDITVLIAGAGGRDLSAHRITAADQLPLRQLAIDVTEACERIRADDDPKFRKSKALMEKLPWWMMRAFLSLASLSMNELHFDLSKLGLPADLFGTGMVTSLGMHAHQVKLPHALKRSPSGRYIGYGSMDHDHKGYACELGIFDLSTNEARVVQLPATVWHLAAHPTKDLFYGPSQRVAPQGHEFGEYTLAHFKNYLFEVDAATATVTRHASIAKELPAAFTSDVAVTSNDVFYNACAGGTLVRVDLETFKRVQFIDERPSFLRSLPHLRSGWSNLVESFSRVNVPGNWHLLLKALRATRFSLLDGSLGLQVSPDGRFILSAHRGLNEVIVYRHPEMKVHKRIRFPSLRGFFPEHVGLLDDPRLGFHHTTLSTATVGG